ncbi:MAG: hypothetical protein ACC645_11320, partial [Pirellulales bacterium]
MRLMRQLAIGTLRAYPTGRAERLLDRLSVYSPPSMLVKVVDGGGRWWTVVDGGGRRWTAVDGGGR